MSLLQRICPLVAPLAIVILFGSTLTGKNQVAYRDVSHFYLPLYDYVAERTAEEWLPLWNPLDQTGIPLLGESTTAVLYPVRYAVWSLPLNNTTAMAWYVVLHLILCSVAARWATRQAGVDPTAATIAGVVYPLSGSVLFLYTNPPFLVGAAWLPLVLGALLAKQQRSLTRVLIAGPSMAMMILGGDPQTALHAMMVACVVCLIRCAKQSLGDKAHVQISWVALIVTPVFAAVLAAPQLAASISWSSRSARVHAEDPRSSLRPPKPDTQRYNAYQFSLPPWHTLELFTSNAAGRLFPINARISALIPGDGRMWTPTIYCGLLFALALITAMLSSQTRDAWFWISIFALTLCFGHFGVVWLLQQTGLLTKLDSAIGGPYWWLYQIIPGYSSFRYPTKWLPIFSLAASVVAARWIDHLSSQDIKKQNRKPLATMGCLVAIGWLVLIYAKWNIQSLGAAANTERDELWGPLIVSTGLNQVQWSLVHTSLALVALVLFDRWRVTQRSGTSWVPVLVVLAAVDLSLANASTIATVDAAKVQDLQRQASMEVRKGTRWMRTRAGSAWPEKWSTTSSDNRFLPVVASERIAWFGRCHLFDRKPVFNNMVSIQSQRMATFWAASRNLQKQTGYQHTAFWSGVRSWLAIDATLMTDGGREKLGAIVTKSTELPKTLPPIRVYDRWQNPKPGQATFEALLTAVAKNSGQSVPILQRSLQLKPSRSEFDSEPISPIAVFDESETISVKLDKESIVTRPVYQDGHWYAEVSDTKTGQLIRMPVHSVDFIKQGVILPPGDWTVSFKYSPSWLHKTLLVSAIAWIGWMLLLCRAGLRSRRAK